MTIDLTDIIAAAIALLGALITAFVVPYLKNKLDDDKWNTFTTIVGKAVEAAEMIFKGSGRGDDKLAYVLNYLESEGYVVDDQTVRVAIESAVFNIQEAASYTTLLEAGTGVLIEDTDEVTEEATDNGNL